MSPIEVARRLGVALVAGGALIAGGGAAVAPVGAQTPDVPVLAGVNTIQSSTSGVATVLLPEKARLDFGFGEMGPAVTGLEGAGRIIGFVFEKNGRILANFMQFSDCGSPGCSGDSYGGGGGTLRPLDPGLYHVYLIADGAPVTATLSFQGLSGHAAIPVSPSSGITEQTLQPLVPSTGVVDAGVYSAGASGTIGPNGGMVLGVFSFLEPTYVAGYADSCVAPGAPPPVYVAGCDMPPDQDSVQNLEYPQISEPGDVVNSVQYGLPFAQFWPDGRYIRPGNGGTFGEGVYFDSPTVLTADSATGVWLSFAPPLEATQTSESNGNIAAPAGSPSASPTPTPTSTTPSGLTNLPNTSADNSIESPASAAVALLGVLLMATRRRRGAGGAEVVE